MFFNIIVNEQNVEVDLCQFHPDEVYCCARKYISEDRMVCCSNHTNKENVEPATNLT